MGIILPSRKSITSFYVNGEANRAASEVDIMYYTPSISTYPQAVNYEDMVCFFTNTYMYIFKDDKFTRGANLPIRWNESQYIAVQTTSQDARFVATPKGVFILGCYDNERIANLWNGSSWVEYPNLKVGQAGNCGVYYNGKVYALGSKTEGYASRVYSYDLTNGSDWVQGGNLPYKAIRSDAVVLGNEIHIFGGTYSGTTNYHYVFNGSSWSASTAIPDTFNVEYGRAVVHDNKIYLLGCASGTKTWVWDNGSWVAGHDMLITMKGDVAFTFDNEVFRAGGTYLGNKFMSYEHQLVGYKMTV